MKTGGPAIALSYNCAAAGRAAPGGNAYLGPRGEIYRRATVNDIRIAIFLLTAFFCQPIFAQQKPIQHDAEHYILQRQHAEYRPAGT